MLKDIKDANMISCKNALDGRYITTDYTWNDLDNDTCYEIFNLCKEYVAKTARGKRRNRILNTVMSQVKSCGILGRLYYDFERERVEYCCGQEWYSEMGILRDCFDGK